MHRKLLVAFLGLVSLVFISGCGDAGKPKPKTVPVKGKVTRNNKPVEGVEVSFINESSPRAAAGKTNAAGEFVLGTFGNADGAVLGDHVVIVTKATAVASAPATNMPPKPEDLAKQASSDTMKAAKADESIPAKYADPKTSGLKATVKGDGHDEFTFDLPD